MELASAFEPEVVPSGGLARDITSGKTNVGVFAVGRLKSLLKPGFYKEKMSSFDIKVAGKIGTGQSRIAMRDGVEKGVASAVAPLNVHPKVMDIALRKALFESNR